MCKLSDFESVFANQTAVNVNDSIAQAESEVLRAKITGLSKKAIALLCTIPVAVFLLLGLVLYFFLKENITIYKPESKHKDGISIKPISNYQIHKPQPNLFVIEHNLLESSTLARIVSAYNFNLRDMFDIKEHLDDSLSSNSICDICNMCLYEIRLMPILAVSLSNVYFEHHLKHHLENTNHIGLQQKFNLAIIIYKHYQLGGFLTECMIKNFKILKMALKNSDLDQLAHEFTLTQGNLRMYIEYFVDYESDRTALDFLKDDVTNLKNNDGNIESHLSRERFHVYKQATENFDTANEYSKSCDFGVVFKPAGDSVEYKNITFEQMSELANETWSIFKSNTKNTRIFSNIEPTYIDLNERSLTNNEKLNLFKLFLCTEEIKCKTRQDLLKEDADLLFSLFHKSSQLTKYGTPYPGFENMHLVEGLMLSDRSNAAWNQYHTNQTLTYGVWENLRPETQILLFYIASIRKVAQVEQGTTLLDKVKASIKDAHITEEILKICAENFYENPDQVIEFYKTNFKTITMGSNT